jgi:adsorption protein B
LYRALANDERREGAPFGAVVLQDAEDLVHPAGLQALAEALSIVDFAQLPVRAEPVAKSPWVAGHYLDEFAESHAKALPVRGALGAALPAAGVGCGFARSALARLTEVRRGQGGPFRPASLTEDYELGLTLSRSGRGARFLRLRDASGNLIATRSCFPASFKASARQKGRWVHGIALQGWDQLGWLTSPVEIWMAFRDRRAPLTALVLACAYFLLAIEIVLNIARHFGVPGMLPPHPAVAMLAWFSMVAFGWRAGVRVISTTHEYGLREGLLSLPRIPVSNAIAITATARAMWAYACSFGRSGPRWDKTAHVDHPALGSDEA